MKIATLIRALAIPVIAAVGNASLIIASAPATASTTRGAPPKDPETVAMVRQWNGECIACHTEQALLFPPRAGLDLEGLADALMDPFAFEQSQHAGMACKTCHSKGYQDYPHEALAAEAILGCPECHAKEAFRVQAQFADSVHARNLSDEFSCSSCHDPHRDRVARDLADASKVVAQDNGKCLECHNSDQRFAELGVTLPETKTRPDIDKIHEWLPNTERHWQAVRCIECHTPQSTHSKLAVNHQILDAEEAERNCTVCHSQDSALNLRLYRWQTEQDISKLGFLNSTILGDSYVIGATRNVYLDRLAYWLVALLLAALAMHGVVRVIGGLAHKRTRKGKGS
jgi:hypothetical protein